MGAAGGASSGGFDQPLLGRKGHLLFGGLLGTKAEVQEQMGQFLDHLASRVDEVKRRCRTMLQAKADALIMTGAGMARSRQ